MMLHNAPEGVESEVLTLDEPEAEYLRALPFRVHALGGERRGGHSTKLVPWLRANGAGYDGVVVHGLWEYLSVAVLRAVAGRVPYVVFAHGMLDPYFKRASRLKHAKKWVYWLPVQYWVLRRARWVVFTTAAERDLATRSFWLHRWNAAVIGLGAEQPTEDREEREACCAAFHALCPSVRESRYLLYLGRLDPKKGCDLLLEAFAAVYGDDAEMQLVMAGPDSVGWRAELQAAAQRAGVGERVHWPGMLTGAAKWGAFLGSEAFVLTSHQENFGIAVVEALACGRPVLVTRPINIANDLVADGCALVEADTAAGATRLLTRWRALPQEERVAMSARAVATVASRYDMRKNVRRLMELFRTQAEENVATEAEAEEA